jgi:hypothetical protein
MTIAGITGITFIDTPIGDLQGSVGYPVMNATNGIVGFSITPTGDRIEVSSDGAITGFGSTGELATLISESDLGWTGITGV